MTVRELTTSITRLDRVEFFDLDKRETRDIIDTSAEYSWKKVREYDKYEVIEFMATGKGRITIVISDKNIVKRGY